MTKKEKEVMETWNRKLREKYVDALESDDQECIAECRIKFVLMTNLTRALENVNNGAWA